MHGLLSIKDSMIISIDYTISTHCRWKIEIVWKSFLYTFIHIWCLLKSNNENARRIIFLHEFDYEDMNDTQFLFMFE